MKYQVVEDKKGLRYIFPDGKNWLIVDGTIKFETICSTNNKRFAKKCAKTVDKKKLLSIMQKPKTPLQ
jgi:hypothetical protein